MNEERPPLCLAASPDGWLCEGLEGHIHCEHFAGGYVRDGIVQGDAVWRGNTRWRQTQAAVWRVLQEHGPSTAREIAHALGLNVSTVHRHLATLLEERAAARGRGGWSSR